MASGASTAVAYEFGPFRLDASRRLLVRDDQIIAASPIVFDLLLVFIRSGSRVISKDELMQAVWPNTFVDDGSIVRSVSRLRTILGNGGYIETVSKHGYRFSAAIRTLSIHPSIAILPFSVLSSPAIENAGLGVGIADALITKLIGTQAVTVRPTSAIVRYVDSDMDVATVGRELHVSAVLEGRLQLSSTQARTTVQLIDVDHLQPYWADGFTIPRLDLFALQEAIAERVATSLSRHLFTR